MLTGLFRIFSVNREVDDLDYEMHRHFMSNVMEEKTEAYTKDIGTASSGGDIPTRGRAMDLERM